MREPVRYAKENEKCISRSQYITVIETYQLKEHFFVFLRDFTNTYGNKTYYFLSTFNLSALQMNTAIDE